MPSYAQEDNEVSIKIPYGASTDCQEKCFIPSKIIARVGDKIWWQNDDTVIHRIVSGNVSNPMLYFDVGLITPDDRSAELRFSQIGQFQYLCSIHPWMQGSLSVLPLEGLFHLQIYSFEIFGEIKGGTIDESDTLYEYDNYVTGIRPTLNIVLKSSTGGTLTIAIPRNLLDSSINVGGDFTYDVFVGNDTEMRHSENFREILDDPFGIHEKEFTMIKLGKTDLIAFERQYRILEIPFNENDLYITIDGNTGIAVSPYVTITDNLFHATLVFTNPEKNLKYRIEQVNAINLGIHDPNKWEEYSTSQLAALHYNLIADNVTASSYDANIFPGNKYVFQVSAINDHGVGLPTHVVVSSSWDSIINLYPRLLEPGTIEIVIFILFIISAIIIVPIIFLRMRKVKRILKLTTIIDLKDE